MFMQSCTRTVYARTLKRPHCAYNDRILVLRLHNERVIALPAVMAAHANHVASPAQMIIVQSAHVFTMVAVIPILFISSPNESEASSTVTDNTGHICSLKSAARSARAVRRYTSLRLYKEMMSS